MLMFRGKAAVMPQVSTICLLPDTTAQVIEIGAHGLAVADLDAIGLIVQRRPVIVLIHMWLGELIVPCFYVACCAIARTISTTLAIPSSA
jgi:hypothetical protein